MWPIQMRSIRSNLFAWLLTGLLIAGLGAGVATFLKSAEEVGEMFDSQLQQIAYSMEYAAPAMEQQVEKMATTGGADNDFMVQLWSVGGKRLYSSRPTVKLSLVARNGFANVEAGGAAWRVFQLTSGDRVIQAAQPHATREEASLEMAMRMLLPLAILLPVLAVLGWIAVRQSLRPLTSVASEVEQRDASSMMPLASDAVPVEIQPLVLALNSLLQRLDASISSQRRFVADAAHELRTPLTALSLQADLIEQADNPDERSEAVEALRNGIRRSSHLVRQLLTLARQEPEAQRHSETLDLAALTRQVVDELFPLANSSHMSIQARLDAGIMIEGEEDGLRAAIGNLIDNAIRYTPEGGSVTVVLHAANGHVRLEVRDTGPGIPDKDWERVFERFYRIPGGNITGSGLGLSIVRQVAQRHHATIDVSAGEGGAGTSIALTFTCAAVPPLVDQQARPQAPM